MVLENGGSVSANGTNGSNRGLQLQMSNSLAIPESPTMSLNSKQSGHNKKQKPRYWNDEEDALLRRAIEAHGYEGYHTWKEVAKNVPNRTYRECMQRWTKVLAPGLKKGKWSPEEDDLLVKLVHEQLAILEAQAAANGNNNIITGDRDADASNISKKIVWNKVAEGFTGRSCKQCRERWINHLDPVVKKAEWNQEEDMILLQLYDDMPNKWAKIARQIPGRTENMVKVRWNALSRQARKRKQNSMYYPGSSSNPMQLPINMSLLQAQAVNKVNNLNLNNTNMNNLISGDLNMTLHPSDQMHLNSNEAHMMNLNNMMSRGHSLRMGSEYMPNPSMLQNLNGIDPGSAYRYSLYNNGNQVQNSGLSFSPQKNNHMNLAPGSNILSNALQMRSNNASNGPMLTPQMQNQQQQASYNQFYINNQISLSLNSNNPASNSGSNEGKIAPPIALDPKLAPGNKKTKVEPQNSAAPMAETEPNIGKSPQGPVASRSNSVVLNGLNVGNAVNEYRKNSLYLLPSNGYSATDFGTMPSFFNMPGNNNFRKFSNVLTSWHNSGYTNGLPFRLDSAFDKAREDSLMMPGLAGSQVPNSLEQPNYMPFQNPLDSRRLSLGYGNGYGLDDPDQVANLINSSSRFQGPANYVPEGRMSSVYASDFNPLSLQYLQQPSNTNSIPMPINIVDPAAEVPVPESISNSQEDMPKKKRAPSKKKNGPNIE